MEWLTKIVQGPNHKGQYHGKYGDDRIWNEPRDSVDDSSDFDREEIDRAIVMSLSEVDQKGKKVIENEYDLEEDIQCIKSESYEDEDELFAKALIEEDERRDKAQQEEYERRAQQEEYERQAKAQLEEDEQLAKAIQESLSIEPPPQPDTPSIFQPFPFFYPPGYRTCAGCNIEIGHGRYLSCMGAFWQPECLRCHGCNQPITDIEFSMSGSRPYHKHCRKEQHHPKCDVCHNFVSIFPICLPCGHLSVCLALKNGSTRLQRSEASSKVRLLHVRLLVVVIIVSIMSCLKGVSIEKITSFILYNCSRLGNQRNL
ncbi:protein DA1-related 1-like [Pistacia vera]|uniref:protein DA1-related 1-like n=1 Tax=Pistacia vera TaxID=55513 RepID=UPI001263B3FF|nr:protein DA1-related 1-like [Pistacia vera]